MSLEKEFVPYEQALKLKELGIDQECHACYGPVGVRAYKELDYGYADYNIGNCIGAPTYSQAFRFFREKYGLPSHIATYWQHDWNNYSYQYYFVQDKVEWNGIEHYKTYEEAELAAIVKLIEIIKNK